MGKSYSPLIDFQQIHIRNIFVFAFGLSVARQLFGENIICHVMRQNIIQNYVDMQCFINGTFTPQDPPIYYDYYQWIPIYFLYMAFIYYPFSIWCQIYGSYIKELTSHVKDEDRCREIFEIIQLSKGNLLFWKTWALEIFYFVNLLIQIGLTNSFLITSSLDTNGHLRLLTRYFLKQVVVSLILIRVEI